MASTPFSSCRRPRRARESGTAANASTNEDVLAASPPATSAASATARWVGRSAGNATGAGSGAWSMTPQAGEDAIAGTGSHGRGRFQRPHPPTRPPVPALTPRSEPHQRCSPTVDTTLPTPWGSPQGSPVSPVLANLFLHYALDLWLTREHPGVVFERYADDVLVHCATRAQAQVVLAGIEQRLRDLGMAVHPDKTRIVYCRDGKRRGRFPVVSFTFLGFMFCPRPSRNHRGEQFLAFLPAISPQALTKIGRGVRRWRLHRRIYFTFEELARAINPIVAGWMAYYGRFYHSRLSAVLARINAYLVRWIRNKYRRLDRTRAAHRNLAELAATQPRLFRPWALVTSDWR